MKLTGKKENYDSSNNVGYTKSPVYWNIDVSQVLRLHIFKVTMASKISFDIFQLRQFCCRADFPSNF